MCPKEYLQDARESQQLSYVRKSHSRPKTLVTVAQEQKQQQQEQEREPSTPVAEAEEFAELKEAKRT